jgi:phosphoribosylformylglycinamidine synthase
MMETIEIDRLGRKGLRRLGIGLSTREVKRIRRLLGRDPTLVELHVFDAEWNEHCSYKSSKATLKRFLPITGPNVIQGPEEDAGIIELDRVDGVRWGLVIAHESHNHPSQILPIEGAATGIGGVVRDVDCMGARVIGVADPLRFGDPWGPNKERVRWVANGVVRGIWEYANALGVPNLGGDVYFDSSFDNNCLVNVVAIGIVREDEVVHSRIPEEARDMEYEFILVGKPTDASGFGGASFASTLLDTEEEQIEAVQVHDPFLKNVLLMRKANEDVLKRARALGYTIGFKDLGGGGLACASSEMGKAGGFGLEIDLDLVHKYPHDLPPEVIVCSETQERYLLVVPKAFTKEVLKIYNERWDLPGIYEGAGARVIGRVKDNKRYILRYMGEVVCDLPIDEVAGGISIRRRSRPISNRLEEPVFEEPRDLGEVILRILESPNQSSREWIYRYYDTEVGGNAFIRPGEADASVITPLLEFGSRVGVALSCDGNPFYGKIDPYWAGVAAVAEAMRNVAAVGAVPSCLTDCLNYGNPETPESFWQFEEGVRGLSDAAKNLWFKGRPGVAIPVISGNVSFYNESVEGGAIPPSPIICCVGILQDYSRAITMRLKEPGSLIYLVGQRRDELGGGAYYREIIGRLGANLPKVDFPSHRGMIYGVIDSISAGDILSCHDISDGGMVVSLVEMMLAQKGGGLGVEVEIQRIGGRLRKDKKLFSESGGFLMEVRPSSSRRVEKVFSSYGVKGELIGQVTKEPSLLIKDEGKVVLRLKDEELWQRWGKGLLRAMR